MALESLPKIAPALFSAEQDLIQIYNKKSDTTGVINPSYIKSSPSGVAGAIQFSDGSAFASDATNLFWDDTNNRLGIGTNAPTSPLNIKGATNTGTVLVSLENSTRKIIDITDRGAINANAFNSANQTFSLGFYGAFDAGGLILNGASNANGVLLAGQSGVDNYILNNLGLGTITPSARLGIRGSGSTSATSSLLVQNSSGLTALSITDDRTVSIGTLSVSGLTTTGVSNLTGQTNITGLSSSWVCQYSATGTVRPLSFSMQQGAFSANNSAIRFGFNFRESGGLMSQDFFQNILYDNTSGLVVTGFEWYTHQTQLGDASSQFAMSLRGKTLSVGTNTPSASAILQADSITQGFLPPRMTTAQRTAIVSPAAGLIVYDTTTNKSYTYDGTAWQAHY